MKTIGWILSDIVALVLGAAIGAGVALMVAPQSGRVTRAKLYSRGVGLREKVTEEAVVARTRARNEINSLASSARIKAAELGDRLQVAVDHQQGALKKAMSAIPVRANGR